MSFRSILSGYQKILNVWSIYLQYLNNRASKQNKELLGFVYEHIPDISLKQQNQYAEHVSSSYYFLIQYVLSSKSSLNCFTTFGSSVCQGSLSWVHTIWHCNLPVAWSTLCHCWGDSQPNVNHCLFLFDLKVTGNLVQQGWIPKPGQAPCGVWTRILPILNVTTYPTVPFSLVFNVYGLVD